MPLSVLLKHLDAVLRDMKAGNRHSAADYDLIDQIAAAAHALGARNIQLIDSSDDADAKSRADALSLTLQRADLFLTDLAFLEM